MGRKRLSDDDIKVTITIRLPVWLIRKLREKKNYNKYIFDILSKYIKKDDNLQ